MTTQRILWYFADPMCSLCWGFSPVMEAIRDSYQDRLTLALMLGGLRPGTIEPVTATFRDEMLQHWRAAQQRSGQSFAFEGSLPDGFIYDTEPPSRAVVAMSQIQPVAVFPYFTAIQRAFYVGQRDVTHAETLAALAQEQGVDAAVFHSHFESDTAKRETQLHFRRSREAGVTGFPTVVLQSESEFELLTTGYRPFAELQPMLDAWLLRVFRAATDTE
jgi:putative protein-disulfide isomerase